VCQASHCDKCGLCGAIHSLSIVSADLGEGAFLRIYCDTCWHREKYQADLRRRRAAARAPGCSGSAGGTDKACVTKPVKDAGG